MNLNFHDLTGLLSVGIPLAGAFAIPIVAIITGHRRQTLKLETRHRERMSAIEKGLPIPPDPVSVPADLPPTPRTPGAVLLRGLIWLGVGLALVFSQLNDDMYRLGWIPVGVGAAYLIYYIVEARRQPGTENP
jgi:hypothetical protein